MLTINHLRKKFGKEWVLNDIQVTFQKGEIVAILGSSGSGKSTLLRCLNHLEVPDGGTIQLDGKELVRTAAHSDQGKLGMVFQSFNLFANMTVLENLVYSPIKVRKLSRESAIEKAKQLLAQVGLETKVNSYPSFLSGGEKQRVAIARTLMMDPEIILFDEPTSALDPEMVQEVLKVIKSLAKTGITMILVTHEMGFVKDVASRVLFLDRGTILKDCSPAEFFGNLSNLRIQRFLATENHA
jgi:polar amino acid transport system ATP-binding protein